ncbi:TIR domain-containing protein [Paludibaculum fermentans]|uniref:TIR domain-containing protein n=1 Tax=Paludibaculum fermentans TaxID=1473598 RepID=UPI003EBC30E2
MALLVRADFHFDAAVLDLMVRETDAPIHAAEPGGLKVAKCIRAHPRRMKILATSMYSGGEPGPVIENFVDEYIPKTEWVGSRKSPHPLVSSVEHLFARKASKLKPSVFIVHGHDTEELLALKNYIQNTLGFPEPVVLRERPDRGRTIIEKFEEEGASADLVFVLATPDDRPFDSVGGCSRRARQNVIFELGFFYAKLQRTSGRVILLTKGAVEIPSDIAGVVYVDITNGVESAGERIRREVAEWLSKGA